MAILIDTPLIRRFVTILSSFTLFVILSLALPVVLALALIVDMVRALTFGTPVVASRLVIFFWIYLLGEMWAVVALASVALMGRARSIEVTYRLQDLWTDWNASALRIVFGMTFEVSGPRRIARTPFVVLARHASLIDSLLPARIITHGWGIRLRYVLKKELLLDPALDLAGSRLPNYFVDRAAPAESEIPSIRVLGSETPTGYGVAIFPEGTRFSVEKRARLVSRYSKRDDDLSRIASSYRRVLPPKPAGALALLDAIDGDVVVLAHHGLEGLGGPKDLWSGRMVGLTVSVETWVIPRAEIPEGRSERTLWLFRTWAEVDEWIVTQDSASV